MHIKTVRQFKPNCKIPRDIWLRIFKEVPYTPSSFGLKPWYFVILESDTSKQKLNPLLRGNNSVTFQNSSAMIFVFGDLAKVAKAEYIFQQKLLHQEITSSTKDILLKNVHKIYDNMNHSQLQNELFLECGIVSAHLAIESQNLGYHTCFIGGCDFHLVNSVFAIDAQYLPIVLLAIGKSQSENAYVKKSPQNLFLLDIEDFVHFI